MSIYGTGLINNGYQESNNIFDNIKECTYEDFLETYYEGVSFIDSRLYALSEGYILEAEGNGEKLGIKEVFEKIIKTISDAFTKAVGWIKQKFEEFKKAVKEKFLEMQQKLLTKNVNKLDYEYIKRALDILKSEGGIKAFISKLNNIGAFMEEDQTREFVNGVEELFSTFIIINHVNIVSFFAIKSTVNGKIDVLYQKAEEITRAKSDSEVEEIVSYIDARINNIKSVWKDKVRSGIFTNPLNNGSIDFNKLDQEDYLNIVNHAPTESEWKINVDFLNGFLKGINDVDRCNKKHIEVMKRRKENCIKNVKEIKKGKDVFLLRAAKEQLKICKFDLELSCSACKENMKLYLKAGTMCLGYMSLYHMFAKKIIKLEERL